jgi:hypothetical protein
MILKGSQRGGARQLAAHLLNERDNEHVALHAVRGFIAGDLRGALLESEAVAKGTKCRQFLFSLSFNPPKGAAVSEAAFERAVEEAERRLGLEGQPRAIVFHEKEGRRHAHAVWSRIDAEAMRAINLPFFKRRLNALSRELYLEHGWRLPDGLRRDKGKSPLNFTLEEWQQAKRLETDPREIKDVFQAAWEQSDNQRAFRHALEERGYFLARGDRRGFVAVDIHGEVFAIARWTGVRTKEVRDRLGEPDGLPTVDEAKAGIARKVDEKLRGFIDEAARRHAEQRAPLLEARAAHAAAHRAEREQLRIKQEERWRAESAARAARLHKGLKGLWQTLTGGGASVRRSNEAEAWECLKRDREQRDALILAQLAERQPVQDRLDELRRRHAQNRRLLGREIARHMRERAPPLEIPDRHRASRRTRAAGFSLDP